MRMEVDWTLLLLPPSPKGHRKKRKRVPKRKLDKVKKHKQEKKQVPSLTQKGKSKEQKKMKVTKMRLKKQKLSHGEQKQKGEDAKL